MNYSDFTKLIKADNLMPAYLFIGAEEYLMNEAIEKVKSKFIEPSLESLNYSIVEGK